MLRLPTTDAFSVLVNLYGEIFSHETGRPVTVKVQKAKGFLVAADRNGVSISYNETGDLFRALGELAGGRICREAVPSFAFRGIMIDCSRNGVIKPEYLKTVLPALALQGLNHLCLYTEDTYEIKGHNLIGYKRGAYTKKEIKALVKFAKQFGITMFPCIQTLGHLSQVLKIPKYAHLRDDHTILSFKEKETYTLIEDMITSATAPYDTKMIHIGMDETWGLGRGKTFDANTKIDPRQIYLDHLKKVASICDKHDLEPIIWGDIVIGMDVSSFALDKKQIADLPKNLTMDYWNYFSQDVAEYKKTIKQFRKMKFEPIISPGVWDWNQMWGNFDKAKRTMTPFLKAAMAEKIDRVLMTMWGDDGHEAPFASNLPALSYYLDTVYRGAPNMQRIKGMFSALFHDSIDTFLLPVKTEQKNIAKGFLYDDPLLGIYSLHAGSRRYNSLFAEQAEMLKKASQNADSRNSLLFKYAYHLTDLLTEKADLRNNLAMAYRAGDKKSLAKSLEILLKILGKVDIVRKIRRELWLQERKIQGWEELDIRYGGIMYRIQTAGDRIKQYLDGTLSTLEEFDEPDRKIYPSLEKFYVKYKNVAKVPAAD